MIVITVHFPFGRGKQRMVQAFRQINIVCHNCQSFVSESMGVARDLKSKTLGERERGDRRDNRTETQTRSCCQGVEQVINRFYARAPFSRSTTTSASAANQNGKREKQGDSNACRPSQCKSVDPGTHLRLFDPMHDAFLAKRGVQRDQRHVVAKAGLRHNHPFGASLRKDENVAARWHSDRNQTSAHGIDPCVNLRVGLPVVVTENLFDEVASVRLQLRERER